MGRCTSIISSPVDLDLPHPVGAGARADDLYLDDEGRVTRRHPAELRVSRRYLIADGVERVEIGGLPADALVLVGGDAQPVSEGLSAAEEGRGSFEEAAPSTSTP